MDINENISFPSISVSFMTCINKVQKHAQAKTIMPEIKSQVLITCKVLKKMYYKLQCSTCFHLSTFIYNHKYVLIYNYNMYANDLPTYWYAYLTVKKTWVWFEWLFLQTSYLGWSDRWSWPWVGCCRGICHCSVWCGERPLWGLHEHKGHQPNIQTTCILLKVKYMQLIW